MASSHLFLKILNSQNSSHSCIIADSFISLSKINSFSSFFIEKSTLFFAPESPLYFEYSFLISSFFSRYFDTHFFSFMGSFNKSKKVSKSSS